MPAESFKLKTETSNANGSVKKGGVVVTLGFAGSQDIKDVGNIHVTCHITGSKNAMKSLFGVWPLSFDDMDANIQSPIEVDVTLALNMPTTAGSMNTMAEDAAKATKEAEIVAATPQLDKVGQEINKLVST